MKNIIVRVFLFGFLVWLIPFVVAFGFYTPEGKLQTDIFLFKTVMILVGNATGCYFLFLLSKRVTLPALRPFTIIGVIWLLENLGLDMLILIPMSKMNLPDYFIQIGLRYFVILFVSATVGAAIDSSRR
ncbi:hypothetical protein LEP1GSC050_4043 [Leptospira broomii serovar Hurstbridge str. 5399]|uniref:Uncharacterized protein n=1 Tax=Leptospira broomii serovar Hurstbridge str. 5399 TaxID=1049789 RepID=T0GEW7_9LEPT|nr:hypothetical protein [Leptospira broomii]EQA43948.1 hypothetical protein LEP1GSC050_4043 [Leptospira broomii serovar Hurstbridge str. 5399]